MMRSISAFAIILAWAAAAWAAASATLTSLSQIHALSNGEGDRGYPVVFEATVTFFRGDESILFVQDGDVAIYIVATTKSGLLPGDRVLIMGTTAGSYNPIVISKSVTLLHHGAPLRPVPASFRQLVKGQFDSRLVTVRGVIRAADLEAKQSWMRKTISEIKFSTDSGPISVYLDIDDLKTLRNLLDTTVEITGVSGGKFDDKMQLTGTVLYVPSIANIKILARPEGSPWSVPVTPLDKILSVYDMHDRTPRVRVQGTITYYQPGHAIVLQDGLKSLWIETVTNEPLRIGDRADAIGFTDAHDRFMSLIDAEIRDSQVFAPIAPRPATWKQLASWSSNVPDGHQNDLVSIEGKVVTEVREATQDEFVMDSDGGLFTAIYNHPPKASDLPPMMNIPFGSRIRLTGICTRTDTRSAIPGKEVPFNILLRAFDDITVVAKPSLINTLNLILAVSLLLVVVIAIGAWGWTLRRKVGQQTATLATMAQFEQRRSHILEKINGSNPLAEIIEEITELVSSMLNGAHCWSEIAGGATPGVRPPNLGLERVIQIQIAGHSGSVLGEFFAGFDRLAPRSGGEIEALTLGARLAALAIETRRLYSDLRRRSEFDLLTEIHNRFSLEKCLAAQIEEAAARGSVFGLIYIDLDKFKQVNDRYGHHIGDLYLQEVTRRMKRQLRGGDILARLGGDEFAALVSVVMNRAEVEEIAVRLERCFDEPFALEGNLLQGSASVGYALYPENGANGDSLLSAADAAMYAVKYSRRRAG
jgi:diguanylate cyclase (GGDEF)-like protein